MLYLGGKVCPFFFSPGDASIILSPLLHPMLEYFSLRNLLSGGDGVIHSSKKKKKKKRSLPASKWQIQCVNLASELISYCYFTRPVSEKQHIPSVRGFSVLRVFALLQYTCRSRLCASCGQACHSPEV